MMTHIRKFFAGIMIVAMATFAAPAMAATSNIASGDIGAYGTWATEHNVNEFTSKLTTDLTTFQPAPVTLVSDFVPPEAKVGIAFMNAMTHVGKVLDISLFRFATIFIIIAFVFWLMFEAYQMMTSKPDINGLIKDVLKKGILVAIWIMVIEIGVAQIFMWVAGPIIAISTYLSDLILNTVTNTMGANLPDTCMAIHQYAVANASPDMLIDANVAADLLCVPTRLSGFFYTGIAAGWKWMIAGIGSSAFTFLVGAGFVILFVALAWKFAFVAFGVIADLFLAILMLPFTAVAETVSKTKYKGIAGKIFNGFLDLFKNQSLDSQISKFINAAIYFVSLAIIVALCTAILSGVIHPDIAADVPSLNNDGFLVTLLAGLLVWFLADKATKLAGDIGGGIDDKIGTELQGNIKKLTKALKTELSKFKPKSE